jgi:hypothetical protein
MRTCRTKAKIDARLANRARAISGFRSQGEDAEYRAEYVGVIRGRGMFCALLMPMLRAGRGCAQSRVWK